MSPTLPTTSMRADPRLADLREISQAQSWPSGPSVCFDSGYVPAGVRGRQTYWVAAAGAGLLVSMIWHSRTGCP